MAKILNIGLLGLGVVGSGLVDLIERNGDILEERTGLKLSIRGALVQNLAKPRKTNGIKLTTRPDDLINDDQIDVIIELIGGLEPAKTLVIESLRKRKSVVTANKALLAEHGQELFSVATKANRSIAFEASVCGGIPLIRSLTDGLIANRIESICGILNGTSNYILTRMQLDGLDYKNALKQAQKLGFAESDPTMDITGKDTAQKLAILCSLAFGSKPSTFQILVQGIEGIGPDDILMAKEFGYTIKLLAYCEKDNGGYESWVRPTFIPDTHPLANVYDENNAVLIRGDAVDDLMLYGKGAGPLPTASAVLSDILSIARAPLPVPVILPQKKMNQLVAPNRRYYLRFPIPDTPGAIGKIGTVLGQHGISISHALATLSDSVVSGGQVKILTHETNDIFINRALSEIDGWPELVGQPISIRIHE